MAYPFSKVRDIACAKWDTSFSTILRNNFLGDLATFEDYRNNVAQGRRLSVYADTNCVPAAKDLKRRFGL
jgi:hypothetical protein